MSKTTFTKPKPLTNSPALIDKAPSIANIERRIKTLKNSSPLTKPIKSEINHQKALLNKLYAKNKSYVLEFEKTNYDYLLLMRSTNNFYKLFGHSALYYTYSLAPKLNLAAHLQEDKDFTNKSSEGFISIKNPAKLAEALQTLNIKSVKTKNQTGDFLLFKFPWTFTEKQITDMNEQNLINLQKFNHIVLVDNAIPVLFIALEELLKALYENIRGMSNPVEKETFGYQLIDRTTKMNHAYLDLTNGHISKLNCLKTIKENLKYVKYHTKLLTDLKIWTPKTCARIGETIIKISDIVEHELKNI